MQLADRQGLLTSIHEIILQKDKTVKAEVKPMMGKEMIVYESAGVFKYGLSSVKNYISLHVMPMYGWAALYSKYKALLTDATFQKGCINFKRKEEMPLEIIRELVRDCSKINLPAIKEAYQKSTKKNGELLNDKTIILPVPHYKNLNSLINCCKTVFESPNNMVVFRLKNISFSIPA